MPALPPLPAHARTKREHLAALQRGLLAARDRLRIQYHEEKALDDCRLWHLKDRVKRKLGIRLECRPQYPPRPLHVPAAYHRPRHLPLFPIISLVTPSLNQGRFLGEAIRSVLEPCYPQLDYIVADAGSTDDTAKVLDPFGAKLLLVKTADDGGPAAALNQGFARARGEIMGTLCADDLLLPGALHCIADYFSRHPQVDVVYGHRVLIDAAGAEVGRWVLPGHNDAVLSAACFVPPETLFWRRSLWDKVGGRFDERLQMAHVWELLLRFRQAGARMVRLPRFLGAYRLHPDQRSAGELALTALVEQQRLRAAGRHRHLIGYLARHLLLDRLYRRGILRY